MSAVKVPPQSVPSTTAAPASPQRSKAGLVACAIAAIAIICCVAALVLRSQAVRTGKAAVDDLRQDLSKAEGKLGDTRKLLETARATLATTQTNLKKITTELETARTEIKRLKQTPRYFFTEALSKAKASDDDYGDEKAIAAFQVVVDRYPEDPLAKVAKTRIGELKERIEGRAKKLKKAQAKVRKLIRICKTATERARKAHSSGIRFNMYNQIDMNSALAASRRGEKHQERAKKAKKKASKLLKTVPDPDGKLAEKVGKCDGTD